MRYEHILSLLGSKQDTDGQKFLKILASFFERIINCNAPKGLLRSMSAAEMVAIPKRASGGVRSISLVDVFCKVANNCALKATYLKIGERCCGRLQ